MRIEILDVGHGQCIFVVADNGNTMLFDCGHDDEAGFRPSEYLPSNGYQNIQLLFVTNYDEDHISDLPALRQNVEIQFLHRNKSINRDQLRAIKEDGGYITNAMSHMLDMMGRYTISTGPTLPAPDFAGLEYRIFHNSYPNHFTDTNNISLVTFLSYGNMHIVIPGDLETDGWTNLLQSPSFREELQRVRIFVAAHHGRQNGYCKEVFDYCRPELVIISDEAKQYATQNMVDTYSRHASGVSWPTGTRRVLTTRSDGMITIEQAGAASPALVRYAGKQPPPQRLANTNSTFVRR